MDMMMEQNGSDLVGGGAEKCPILIGAFHDSLEMMRRKSAPLATQTYSMKLEAAF